MIKVNSIKEYIQLVQKDIESDLYKITNQIAEDIKSMLWIYTQEWYTSNSPSTYARTYEFINSLKIRSIDNSTVEIGFDMSELTLGDNNGFEQHSDAFYPLSEIIDNGWTVYPSNKRIEGSHAIERTIQYMNSNSFINEANTILKQYGYNLK